MHLLAWIVYAIQIIFRHGQDIGTQKRKVRIILEENSDIASRNNGGFKSHQFQVVYTRKHRNTVSGEKKL